MKRIFETIIDDLIPYNKDYKDALYEIKKKSSGVKKSNSGGWHSEDISNFITFLSLKRVIDRIVKKEKLFDRTEFHSMWGNINPPLTWNERHNHPGLALSGCYYIQTGTLAGNFLIEEDDDYFNLPPITEIVPQDGMLIIFDAEYYHSVNKNLSKEDRISIAFNLE